MTPERLEELALTHRNIIVPYSKAVNLIGRKDIDSIISDRGELIGSWRGVEFIIAEVQPSDRPDAYFFFKADDFDRMVEFQLVHF